MYLDFYELSRQPFNVTPDPENIFLSPTHREALAGLIYGVDERKGFIVLTGEVGLGKTTLVRSMLEQIDRTHTRVVYIFNPIVDPQELLGVLFDELELPAPPDNRARAVRQLYEHLIGMFREGRTLVLVIDEAQRMPVETLEALRLLSNLETTTQKLIQIVLVGQPELDELLQRSDLRQLNQRVTVRVRLNTLELAESVRYLHHRLDAAACSTLPVMTEAAIAEIAAAAGGVPRLLNVLADNALLTGFGYGRRPVDTAIVREVVADSAPVLPRKAGGRTATRRRWPIAACVAGLALLVPLGPVVPDRLAAGAEAFIEAPLWRNVADRLQVREWLAALPTSGGQEPQRPPAAAAPPPAPAPGPPREDPASPQAGMPPQTRIAPPAEPAARGAAAPDTTAGRRAEVRVVHTQPPPPPPTYVLIERVMPGDSIWKMLTRIYGESTPARLSQVIDANPDIGSLDLIRPGQRLKFPIGDGTRPASAQE